MGNDKNDRAEQGNLSGTEPTEIPAACQAQYETLEKTVLEHNPTADVTGIRRAFRYAARAHGTQRRRDGSPYVTHCTAAAQIAAEMGLDEDSIMAALLHDVLEDTSVTDEEMRRQFGPTVTYLVEGVTKLTSVQYSSREDKQMENLRKMLLAMAKDIRVILIKIADRLHNMRTMDYQSPEKQLIKSQETMQIYAPIAHRLGMQRIKWELEDLSIQYIAPEACHQISEALNERMDELEKFMQSIEARINARLAEWHIKAMVYGRIKHLYSIYRKMYTQHLSMSEIFDLCAFRVIVDTVADCYNVLGHIHDMFKPVPGRFKDYISTPKPNMYQSLHTTVIGTEGIPFEVQIRTWEMHHTAEYGIAAHWKYKTGESGVKAGDEEKFAWIRRLLESQQDSDAQDFFHDLKIDMFADEVFVFSPKGDVINLPAGATPIDFAYGIHSAVGNSMIGAKVNGRIVPFDHELQNGDIVEALTSKSAPGPSRDWMLLAKSGAARTKIKQWFKKERREENIQRGREMFEAELRRAGLPANALSDEKLAALIIKKLAITSLDDMYAAIGYGGMSATRSVNRVRDELQKAKTAQRTVVDRINEQIERRSQAPAGKPIRGVLVEGLDNCLVKFSRCCTPVPGDEIVGFITRGQGVSIHRKNCPNYTTSLAGSNAGRWIPVCWAQETTDRYATTLRILAKERAGLVMDIATVLNAVNANVRSLNARDTEGGAAVAVVTLEVSGLPELQLIINRLTGIKGVTEVTRAGA
ncbi:MAG: bifunctional (p)ppGpp synthetase/guanosine-3',5'-bis(diphosphate) 3'-pyrophosphohydrolase [Clostridiales bacterium]|nr:bifunctional (p)ppGpp synthetase/guanosine-3',5'-bis(diphosphate) 3'-pyrophosphohydrolase [Clostridiales bacterium]